MASSSEKKVAPPSIHDRDMRTLGANIRTSIVFMIVTAITGDLENVVELAIRSVRRRWDVLCPPAATEKDRKSLTKSMMDKRAAWDIWFSRFAQNQELIESLNKQIDIVNSIERDGFEEVDPIARVDVLGRVRAGGERLSQSSSSGAARSAEQGAKGGERAAKGGEQGAKGGEQGAKGGEQGAKGGDDETQKVDNDPTKIPPPPNLEDEVTSPE